MNITKGPTLQRFAEIFDWTIEEVLEWVNGYVNSPETSIIGPYEATEAERFSAMRKYIDWRIETSTQGRIERLSAESQRLAA